MIAKIHHIFMAKRLHYLDWLRILVVLGVFYAHSADMFDFVDWRIKYREHSTDIMIFTTFGTQWGMALLFWLAGTGAWFTLRSKTGFQFISERFKRLVIPFLFGSIILSPLQAYFASLRRSQYQGDLLQFYPYFFQHIHIGSDLRWLVAIGYHLWFLAFLFAISALCLPVLLYTRHEPCQSLVRRLQVFCERPGGIFVLTAPIAVIQIVLQAPFPGYQGWADFVSWLVFFLYGYILLSDAKFEYVIKREYKRALLMSASALALLLTLYLAGFAQAWENTSQYSPGYLFYQLLRGVTLWPLTMLALYIMVRFINFSNKLLPYLTEATLPFYIFHYPVVSIITFYVIQWNIPLVPKFLIASSCSLLVTLAIYHFFIKPFRFTRWLCGMKQKPVAYA